MYDLFILEFIIIYLFTFGKTMKKKVSFGDVTVYHMYVWTFAYKQARRGQWHIIAIDNERFINRIQKVEQVLYPILEKKLQKIKQNE